MIPGIHSVGGWVDPRDGLDDVERRKSQPYRVSFPNYRHLYLYQSLYRLCYPCTLLNSKWLSIKSCFCCLVYAYTCVHSVQNIINILRIFVLQNRTNVEAIAHFRLEDLYSDFEFYFAARAVGLGCVCYLGRWGCAYVHRGLLPGVHYC
jgi:hypothetical protein